nr:spidroin-1-like [Aegilops tauschii subsp. strangulata]
MGPKRLIHGCTFLREGQGGPRAKADVAGQDGRGWGIPAVWGGGSGAGDGRAPYPWLKQGRALTAALYVAGASRRRGRWRWPGSSAGGGRGRRRRGVGREAAVARCSSRKAPDGIGGEAAGERQGAGRGTRSILQRGDDRRCEATGTGRGGDGTRATGVATTYGPGQAGARRRGAANDGDGLGR